MVNYLARGRIDCGWLHWWLSGQRGSLSRSSLNLMAGAQTAWSSVTSGLVVVEPCFFDAIIGAATVSVFGGSNCDGLSGVDSSW